MKKTFTKQRFISAIKGLFAFVVLFTMLPFQGEAQLPTVPAGYGIRVHTSGGLLAGQNLMGIAADLNNGTIYIAATTQANIGVTHSSFNLYKILPNGSVILINNYPFSQYELIQMTCGPDGQIYVLNSGNAKIMRIDPTSGAATVYANSPSTGRHDLNFDPNGNLIIGFEAMFSFYKIQAGTNALFLGNVSAAIPNGNHGDAFGIQPNGNYVVYPDGGPMQVYVINTSGHVPGTNYPTMQWMSPTNLQTPSYYGSGALGYSNGTVDPVTGDIFTINPNFGLGNSMIAYTPANGGASSLFVTGAGNGIVPNSNYTQGSGITDLVFGAATNGCGNSLYFTDRHQNKVYEVYKTCATISTSVTSTNLCKGGNVAVDYTITGTFNAGNTFTAQLSDASGSFASPANIGSVSATISGTINGAIPAGTPVGAGYRIRVVASDPATTSLDNGSNLSVNALPIATISAGGPTTFCPSGSVTLTSSAGGSYLWSNGATNSSISAVSSGNYTVTVTTNGCSATSDPITVTVQDNLAPVPNVATLPNATGQCSVTVSAPKATDNCKGQITATTSDPLVYNSQGTYTIHWTYDDGNGNTSTQTQTVIVLDTEAPVFGTPNATGDVVYLKSNTSVPWNSTINETGLNTVFGVGGWKDYRFETVNVSTLFSNATRFIYMEGGDATANELNAFITANRTQIENWVSNGGHLLLNAAPNEGGNINFGFGGVTLVYPSFTVTGGATVPAHPIFNAPYAPVGTTWIGGYLGHSILTPPGTMTKLVHNVDNNLALLVEANWGTGKVMFGGFTFPYAPTWSQQAQSNLYKNILSYLATAGTNQGNISVNADANQCGKVVTFATPTATDNCSTVTVSQIAGLPSGSVFPVGTTTNTFEASDAVGNKSTYSFTVTVADNLAPVPDVVSLPDVTVECSVTVTKPSATDNCKGSVTATTTDPLTYSTQGTYTITWTYDDGNGNTSSQTQKVIVKDVTAPTFTTSPANITVGCDASTAPSSTGTAAASDNCTLSPTISHSDVSTQNADPSNAAHYNFTITRTWRAEDAVGLTSTYVQTITVQDITSPSITCPANKLSVPFDFNQTYATINIGTATATDNCAPVANIAIANNSAYSSNDQYPLGQTLVQWTATDPSSNAQNCTQTIEVRKRNTAISYTGAMNNSNQICVQYSDIINLQAKLTDNESAPFNNISGRAVVFELLNSSNVVLRTKTTVTDANGIAADTFRIVQAPGTYSIRTSFAGDANFNGSQDSDPTIIKQEDALVDYSGSQYFTTSSSTNLTGTVNFQASVNDIDDGTDKRGDIRKAKITFRDGGPAGTLLGTANNSVGLVNPGVLTEGLSSTSQNFTLNNNEAGGGGRIFQVWVGASDHYTGTDAGPTPVTLALPGQDYVTGGGHYAMQNAAGTYAGTANAKMNFGFTMKWNKSGKNLQGQINIVYRRWQLFNGVMQWRIFQIKSNAINSMAVRLEGGYSKAVINTKATLNDVTDPSAVVSYGGGHDLTLEAWDHTTANGGSMDKIGVRLVSGSSEMLFVSSWSASALQIQQITGGNVNARSNNGAVPPSTTTARESNNKAVEAEVKSEEGNELNVNAYPNPSRGHFTVIVQSNNTKEQIRLRVMDISGRVIETNNKVLAGQNLQLGDNYFPGTYFVEVQQGNSRKQVKVIRLSK